MAHAVEHAALPFHPDCPRCRQERLQGQLPAPSCHRATAAVAATLALSAVGMPVAVLSAAPPAVADEDDSSSTGDAPTGLPPDVAQGLQDENAPPPPDTHSDASQGPPNSDPDGEAQAPPPIPPAGGPPPPAAPTAPPAAPTALPPEAPPPRPPVPPEGVSPPAPPAAAPEPQPSLERKAVPPKTMSGPEPKAVPPRPASSLERDAAGPAARPPASPGQSSGAGGPEPIASTASAAAPDRAPASGRPQGTQPISAPSGTYRVVRGDSLWSIARRVVAPDAAPAEIARTVEELWRLNARAIGTGSPDLVAIGTTLHLPTREGNR